jgi:O-antigen biosynthesis protein
MKVSIIIPAYNQSALTINCLKGVLTTCGVDFEVLLVDDGSTEPVYQALPRLFPTIQILRNDTNLGFIKSTNLGLKTVAGTHCLMLNNDIIIHDSKWLKKMVDGLESRGLDLAALAGGNMSDDWHYISGETKSESEPFTYLAGWCLLMRREVVDRLGGLDESYGIGFWDDVDLSLRAKRAGFKLGIVEGISVEHLYHSTFKAAGVNILEQYEKNRLIFLGAMKEYE